MPHSVGLLTNLAKVKLPHSVGFSYKIKLRVPHCVGLVTQVICEGAPLRGGLVTKGKVNNALRRQLARFVFDVKKVVLKV